jgi:hypothetical protein
VKIEKPLDATQETHVPRSARELEPSIV